MMIKCCKGCERRHVGCHSECKEYIHAKKEHDKVKHDIEQEMEYQRYRGDLNNVMKKEAFRKKNFKRSKGPANI